MIVTCVGCVILVEVIINQTHVCYGTVSRQTHISCMQGIIILWKASYFCVLPYKVMYSASVMHPGC